MAVVLIEGFDHLTQSQVTLKGWGAAFNSISNGRFGGQSVTATTNNSARSKALPSSYSTLYAGFAVFPATVTSLGDFVILQAGSTQTFRIGVSAASKLIIRNSGGTTIATGTTTLIPSTWYYIEVKAVINGASGTCELHLNGVSGEIASTTGNFGSSNLDTICLIGITSQTITWDDVYVLDTTGSAPRNTFLGDVRVATIVPTGAGNSSQWTPNGAANNWDCLDETTPDGDTTYVSDSTPGHIDTYACSDIDANATVYGVQTNLYARKDDAAARQIAPVIRQSGTDNVGTTVTLSSSYTFYSQLYNQDPTAADWTPTTVNGDEFGIKEIA